MKVLDISGFAMTALQGARTRTLLMLLAMAIGVASVLLLTSLGEAARRYVTSEFMSLGTNLVIVLPGRSETAGGTMQLLGGTTRDLTISDALALTRSAKVRRIAPINVGSAPVSWKGLEREVPIMGSTAALLEVRHWEMAQGRFLPEGDMDRARPVCVLGATLKEELFGSRSALGEWVRIGDWRYRVIGVMSSSGRSMGVDVQDIAIIPVASAQQMFNLNSLIRILVEATSREAIPDVIDFARQTIRDRHQGEEDVTVITQDAILATFDEILQALTLSVGGIAAISLIVAGILIMNVMLITISQRTAEIGLLKALGAPDKQVTALFLAEASLLSVLGALIGMAIGELGSRFIGFLYPVLPMGPPWWAYFAAMGVAIGTGIVFSLLPARRASHLDPVMALARK